MTDSTPARPKIVAYYRVSTQRQGRSGLGLEAQQVSVHQYVTQTNGEIIASFQEVESGKDDSNRPELQKAIRLCRQKKALLVIARIDRLARDVAFTANLMKSKVKFICCDMPEANDLTLHIVAAVAQNYRATVSKNTKDALAAAKARGKKLGREGADVHAMAATRQAQTRQFRAGVYPLARQLRDQGLTLRQIADELNEREIKTCNDRTWYAQTVNRLLKEAA